MVRWIPPNELQLTIMALGELTAATLQQIQGLAGQIVPAYPRMTLCIEGLGGTPNNIQPRFLWCGVTGGIDALSRLQQALEGRFAPLLRDYQVKPFQPHLDLGRIRIESEQNRTALGRAIKMAQVGVVGDVPVNAIELLRSETTNLGPTLVALASYPLQ